MCSFMSREELMSLACANPFREAVREHRIAKEHQECEGPEYELESSRVARRNRERIQDEHDTLGTPTDVDLGLMDKEDKAYRAAHPDPIFGESLSIAKAYIETVDALQRKGLL